MPLTAPLLRGFGAVGSGGGSAPATPTLAVSDDADGTATATISGSSGSSSNVVWYQAIGGTSWTSGGSRTGDGTVDLATGAGYFVAYCASTLNSQTAASSLVRFRVTSGTTAVYEQILTAVQAAVQNLDLTGVSDSNVMLLKVPTDRIRDLPSTRFPAVIVAPTESIRYDAGTNRRDDIIYPVLVAAVAADNQDQTSLRARYLKWSQDVRRRFHLPAQGTVEDPFASITEVVSCEVDPRPVVDPPNWIAANLWVSGWVLRVRTRESRTV